MEVLDLCIKLFEYPGTKAGSPKGNTAAQQPKKTKASDSKARLQTLEEAILNRGAAREMLQRHRAPAASTYRVLFGCEALGFLKILFL